MWVSRHPDWWAKHEEAYKAYRERNKYYCCVCFAKKQLVLNHMHYETFGHEDVLVDLNWLCRGCHHNFHYPLFTNWLNMEIGRKDWRTGQHPHDKLSMRRRLYWITLWCAFWQTITLRYFRPLDVIWYGILVLMT